MVPVFDISSSGSTATVWLSGLLNKHPQIVCFHALRHDPFSPSQRLAPEQLISGLSALAEHHGGPPKTFGTIHSFYGSETLDALRTIGGGTAAIIRNPIRRIHSQFTAHYQLEDRAIRDADIYGTIVEDGTAQTLAPMFGDRVRQCLYSDLSNFARIGTEGIFRFERIVGDPGYCHSFLKYVLQDDLEDFRNTIEETMKQQVNTHRVDDLTTTEIVDRWPVEFRQQFFAWLAEFGQEKFSAMYEMFEYDLKDILTTA